MKHFIFIFLLFIVVLTHFPRISHAALNDNMMSFSLGYYDILDRDNGAMDIRGEMRFKKQILGLLNPWAGIEITSDGALYGAGGFLIDINLTDKWHLTPSLGAGLYEDGNGKILGHTIQFRSQLELSYEFENNHRLGVSFSHLSNCHLDDNNPGSEILSLTYSLPLSYFPK